MRRGVIVSALFLSLTALAAYSDASAASKDAASQKLSAKVKGLDKDVQIWHADSEQAGRQTRRKLNQYIHKWTSLGYQTYVEKNVTWQRLRHRYLAARAFLMHQIAEFRALYKQVQSFLKTK